jgi:hypothetical protein
VRPVPVKHETTAGNSKSAGHECRVLQPMNVLYSIQRLAVDWLKPAPYIQKHSPRENCLSNMCGVILDMD